MSGFITRCSWWGVAAACAVVVGGCSTSRPAAGASAPVSPLTKSIKAFFHALSVQQVNCARPTPGSHGRRSCQVQFTDNYGEWWVTIVVAGSRVISDPGGVADWLCATACSNPPAMTANTGNPRNNPGFTAAASTGNSGQTGVTGIGGVVKTPSPSSVVKTPGPSGPAKVTSPSGVVNPTGSTGVVNPTGSTGVVNPTGSTGVVNGSGNTSTIGQTGATGIVYGTGSTGPGG
ncbi:MAG: hypothetical protein M3071_00375 [Actinomycetota bacterium]|nr:hypothetical protein [Actinomycetota bacterium]